MNQGLFFLTANSFLLSWLIIVAFRNLSLKFNLLKPKGMPLVGGFGVGLSFLVMVCLAFYYRHLLTEEVRGILFASVTMLIFGVIDDWREFSIWAKFLVQIIAVSCLVVFGVKTQIAFLNQTTNLIVTFIWVLGITNAFNHLDVMDGIAGGVGLIVSGAFFFIGLLSNDIKTTLMCLVLAGSITGFLFFNWPPAKAYMGNSGSHFIGFLLAAIALNISYAPQGKKIALLSPLLILGLPIFDTSFLILTRLLKKNLPFNKSNDHLSLRYQKLGFSKRRVLFTMLSLAMFYSLCGVAVSHFQQPWDITILFVAALCSLIVAFKMGRIVIHG